MKSSPLNYIAVITNKYMEESIHIDVYIPVTITHVKENKTQKKKNIIDMSGYF